MSSWWGWDNRSKFARYVVVDHCSDFIAHSQSRTAGIPTIIKPFFGDQFFWGDRVEALGIGASVRKLTVENLSHALREATTNQKLIDRARVIGEQIRAVGLIRDPRFQMSD